MTEEQRIFMAVGKALVKTVRERFPVSSNIKSLWENSGQIGSPYSYYIVQLIRAKRKNSILKNVISSAKRSLKFGERDALCDELCYLVFSLLYMSDIFLPQNSFVTFFHVEGSHVFLVLHTDLGVKSFSSPFGQYDVEFEAGFKQIKEFFEKRNAVIIDPWISCVVPVEDWLSLGKQADSLSTHIIENTIKELNTREDDLLAWLGPAIGKDAFIVGKDVYDEFKDHKINMEKAFLKYDSQFENKYKVNIYEIAKQILVNCKLNENNIYGGDFCTYTNSNDFFSYRRDGEKSGRMVHLIWLTKR